VLPDAAAPALADAALDPAELLDVDVHELAGSRALIAHAWLASDPSQPAHPDPGQDPGDGRERHRERLGDLGAGHSEPA